MHALALLPVVLHDDTRAANDLPWVALAIDFAETRPRPEGLRVGYLDEVGTLLSAERFNELEVLRLGDGLHQHAEVGLPPVERLGTLTETASKAVMNEGLLQNLL